MARKRIGMNALRMVIELHHKTSLSFRRISEASGVSRPVVAQYIQNFSRTGLSFEEFSVLPDSQLLERLGESKSTGDPRHPVLLEFFPYAVVELSRVGVTRELLWREYKDKHPQGYQYTQFCHYFKLWQTADPEVTMHIGTRQATGCAWISRARSKTTGNLVAARSGRQRFSSPFWEPVSTPISRR